MKVLDFGLAKSPDGGNLTHGSVVIGTPSTMAPELFEGADRASALSDLYAVGCVAYALLTGRNAFEGDSLVALCNAHLTKTPTPPSEVLGRAVDPTLERVIAACLAKDPSRRPQSAREILALFERCPVVNGWTVADANTFWTTNAGKLAGVSVAEAS